MKKEVEWCGPFDHRRVRFSQNLHGITQSLRGIIVGHRSGSATAPCATKSPPMRSILTVLCVFASCSFVVAQSTECNTATMITVAAPGACGGVNGTNANATDSGSPPSCDATTEGYADVWYSFTTGSAATSVTITLSPGATMTDWAFAVYSGCGGAEVNCSISPAGPVIVNTTPNTTYKLQIYSNLQFGVGGNFYVCVERPQGGGGPPTNNECAGSVLLNVGVTCLPVSGSLSNATTSPAASSCSPTPDVWYRFVATATEMYVAAASGASTDLVLGIYSGSCAALTEIGCADFTGTGGSEDVTYSAAEIGQTYWIRVWNLAGASSTPSITICVFGSDPVANDECSSATALTVGTTCLPTAGSLVGASISNQVSNCPVANDVWYSFVATAALTNVRITGGADADLVYSLHSSICAAFSPSTCINNGGVGEEEQETYSNLVVGQTYRIRIWNLGGATPSAPGITVCVWSSGPPPPPPVNDDCAGALDLPVNSTCGYTNATGLGATGTLNTPSCSGGGSVWFRFLAPPGVVNITVDGDGNSTTGYDATVILAFAANCVSNANILSCVDNTGRGGTESLSYAGLVPGNPYYIIVAHEDATYSTPPTFRICVNGDGATGVVERSQALYSLVGDASTGHYEIRFDGSGNASVQVLDGLGRMLQRRTANVQSGSIAPLDLADLPPGAYMISVIMNGVQRTQRVGRL